MCGLRVLLPCNTSGLIQSQKTLKNFLTPRITVRQQRGKDWRRDQCHMLVSFNVQNSIATAPSQISVWFLISNLHTHIPRRLTRAYYFIFRGIAMSYSNNIHYPMHDLCVPIESDTKSRSNFKNKNVKRMSARLSFWFIQNQSIDLGSTPGYGRKGNMLDINILSAEQEMRIAWMLSLWETS